MTPTQTYKVPGFDCAEEVAIRQKAVGPIIGGPEQMSFDVADMGVSLLVVGNALRLTRPASPSAAPLPRRDALA